MSELKAITVYDAYWKANSVGEGTGILVYLKSEADKFIAEKDKEISRLNDKALQYKVLDKEHCRDLNAQERRFALQIAHQKYKRCRTMAKWCESTSLWCYQAACTLPKGFHATLHDKPVMIEPTRLFKRQELLAKWSERWLELAEKFKETK